MIPKIIHYCWLSNDPVPVKLKEYMKSWEQYLPDYEFMLWNFDRFDINNSLWVKQAFENKKYAFAADYIRLYAVYNYGGIYLDMDVEVLKSFNSFLHLSSMLCYEKHGDNHFEMAAFGVQKHSLWIKECLTYYDQRRFAVNGRLDTTILPLVIKEALALKFKLVPVNNINEASAPLNDPYEIRILPSEFFSPKYYWTGKLNITSNTISIHHFNGSWLPSYLRLEAKVYQFLGLRNFKILERILLKIKILKLKTLKVLS